MSVTVDLRLGDCLEVLRQLPDQSIDACITDPPYAEVKRDYGRWTEEEWWELMAEGVVPEVRRVLKPQGSAVFIIQPNSRKVGSMRGWVFRFMYWVTQEWNMVQDCYWWNFCAAPTGDGVHRDNGLMKGSIKPCVWCGPEDCWRDQSAVLWEPSESTKAASWENRCLRYSPSGVSKKRGRLYETAMTRDGCVPFNLVPCSNTGRPGNAASYGHGAGTPLPLARWWTRYICPPGGVVLDPFFGAGTMGVAAVEEGRSCIGIERVPEYVEIAKKRIAEAQRNYQPQLALV